MLVILVHGLGPHDRNEGCVACWLIKALVEDLYVLYKQVPAIVYSLLEYKF